MPERINKNRKDYLVIGAGGLLGRYIVSALLADGANLICTSRTQSAVEQLRIAAPADRMVAMRLDVSDSSSIATLAKLLPRCDGIVYCVGDLFPRPSGKAALLYHQLPAQLAKLSQTAGIRNFVLISTLIPPVSSATGQSSKRNLIRRSEYFAAKIAGENAVRKALPEAVILRPGYLMAPSDHLLLRFVRQAAWLPLLAVPISAKITPVAIEDVAAAVAITIADNSWHGQTIQIIQDRSYTMRELVKGLLANAGMPRYLIPIPRWLLWPLALLNDLLGLKILSRDQLRLLAIDSIPDRVVPDISVLPLVETSVDKYLGS